MFQSSCFPCPATALSPVEIVPRSARTGQLVAEVVAEDADNGANAWLSYHISQASDSSLFQISANMGDLLTAHLVLPTDAEGEGWWQWFGIMETHRFPPLSHWVCC